MILSKNGKVENDKYSVLSEDNLIFGNNFRVQPCFSKCAYDLLDLRKLFNS